MDTLPTRGSLWRKWDLHVHTPCSLKNDYGGDNEKTWERFLSELESLPESFDVIGVNDYFFIDGYERLLEYSKAGRLKNIHTILPVIELRLQMFGGTESRLSKVNYHVIFSEQVSAETIRDQFLPELRSKVTLHPTAPGASAPDFDGIVTRESITELGRKIIESAPDDAKKDYGSPAHEGFSSLVWEMSAIKNALDKPYFKGKHLTAIGKAEWADIKWTPQVVAAKKSLINEADVVFTAAESPSSFEEAKASLRQARVNYRLLDCSDAHNWGDSNVKDRIGNCAQWIKADPTFEGLRHSVLSEIAYAERTFVGTKPDKLRHVEKSSTKYIDELVVEKKPGSDLREEWFSNRLHFNPGLVAIIGNRGNGKSALTDILGLLGGSHTEHFSFLDKEHFLRQPVCKGSHFEARIVWRSGEEVRKALDESVSPEEVERVRYIPQGYFEHICNEIIEGDSSDFEREIESVVLSHVPKSKRLEAGTLRELIELRTKRHWDEVARLRERLAQVNNELVSAEKKLTEDHRKEVKAKYNAKWDELAAHLKSRPEPVDPPEESDALHKQIEDRRARKRVLERRKATIESLEGKAEKKLNALVQVRSRIEQLEARYKALKSESEADMELFNFSLGDLLSFSIDLSRVNEERQVIEDRIDRIGQLLDDSVEGSLESKIKDVESEIGDLTEKLDANAREYEEYQTELEGWNEEKYTIIGKPGDHGSLSNLCKRASELERMPENVGECRSRRRDITIRVHEELVAVSETYQELHKPVHRYIQDSELIQEEYAINFEVVIRNTGFTEMLLSKIDQSVKGSFRGREEGRHRLSEWLDETDFGDEGNVVSFCDRVMEALHVDVREAESAPRDVDRQLVKGVDREDIYNLVYGLEYLSPAYELRLGQSSIEHLSPGERGIALLIFYLLVSQDDRPLIIDQPEGNLDSQSVYSSLAPCIRRARERRQVFLVTHSPNLAVVCDAEQIIHASIDKGANFKVEYRTGAIEDPKMNEVSVDILEGTPPAFRDRRDKYHSLRRSRN